MLSVIATATAAPDSADSAEEMNAMIGGVARLSGLMSDYGILVVILSVIIVVFFIFTIYMLINNARMIKNFIQSNNTNNSNVTNMLGEFVRESTSGQQNNSNNTGLREAIKELKDTLKPMSQAIEELKNKDLESEEEDYHKNIVGAYIDVNMTFKDASRAALNKIGCDRVAIYTFHNGNMSIHGLPFFKMSCIHEWTKTGASTFRGKSHTDLPLHLFSDFIEDLWKNGEYMSEDVEKSQIIDPSIKEFIAYSETKSLYIKAVKNYDDIITGFIIAEFDHVETFEHDQNRYNEVKEAMDEMSTKVLPILGSKYVYKNPVDYEQK